VIRVEALPGAVGSEISFPEVLLRSDDSGLTLGSPLVAGASVSGLIVSQERARKILIYKKKRRKNYRRHQGHRQPQTTVRVMAVA